MIKRCLNLGAVEQIRSRFLAQKSQTAVSSRLDFCTQRPKLAQDVGEAVQLFDHDPAVPVEERFVDIKYFSPPLLRSIPDCFAELANVS